MFCESHFGQIKRNCIQLVDQTGWYSYPNNLHDTIFHLSHTARCSDCSLLLSGKTNKDILENGDLGLGGSLKISE